MEIDSLQSFSKSVIRDFENELEQLLFKTGIYFRLFSRIKSVDSLKCKILQKREKKDVSYKIKDLIGFRIVLYFKEDIKICENLLFNQYKKIEEHVDKPDEKEFSPQRINYTFEIPERFSNIIPHNYLNYAKNTFEVQLRTIFSEGWHEVEHDLRYKCKDKWEKYKDDSRTLNGILATLENCDWAISKIFDELAYKNFKNNEWSEMIKNKFRVHLESEGLSNKIINLLNTDSTLGKKIYKANRYSILMTIQEHSLPLVYDNLFYLILLQEKINVNIDIPKTLQSYFTKDENKKEDNLS